MKLKTNSLVANATFLILCDISCLHHLPVLSSDFLGTSWFMICLRLPFPIPPQNYCPLPPPKKKGPLF